MDTINAYKDIIDERIRQDAAARAALGKKNYKSRLTALFRPEWNSWHMMNQRCYNPKLKAYRDYGAKGVTVCERWRRAGPGTGQFLNFLYDVGPRPTSAGWSIDRINSKGHYELGNVRWADTLTQGRNRDKTYCNKQQAEVEASYFTYKCVTKTVAEWLAENNRRFDIFKDQVRRGVPWEVALGFRRFSIKTDYLNPDPDFCLRNRRFLPYNGRMITAKRFAEQNGFKVSWVHARLQEGWTLDGIMDDPECRPRKYVSVLGRKAPKSSNIK